MKDSPILHKQLEPFRSAIGIVLALLIAALGAGGWYGYQKLVALSEHVALVESKLAETTMLLENSIVESHNVLSEALSKEKESVTSIKEEVGDITGTVSSLEKLSKTDPELLQKYSRVFFLNEHYAPARLTEIPDSYDYFDSRDFKIHAEVWPYLKSMLDEANKDGPEILVFSAFRTFNEQGALKGTYTVTYGAGTANQFSADQGYSEHQLGTTVDLITLDLGGTLDGFEQTDAYEWLLDNAYRFGFVLSYPQNNTFYVFEPWHWRFVGVKLATDLHKSGKHFYDLDQREIDSYLISIFD